MFLTFDQPALLLLALVIAPLLVLGWRATLGMDPVRRVLALLLRAALAAALCIMLAGPHLRRTHDHLTVIGLLDTSGSIRRFADLPEIADLGIKSNLEYLRRWFRQATQTKAPDDRFGLIVFDGEAIAISAPTKASYVDDNLDVRFQEGTNIAEAINLGLAMFPADTARRLVLVSDGNETMGSVINAARQAAGAGGLTVDRIGPDRLTVPIDVLPIAYRVTGDVQVVRIETPPTAQPGQTVTARIILEATRPTRGRLTLLREHRPVDLNGRDPGNSRDLDLPEGQSVHLAQVILGHTPINRFEAIFEPADPNDDQLPDNNRAEAFTATPAKGTVLVVDRLAGQEPNNIADVLTAADVPARAERPEQFPYDLLSLQAFDLIILDNIAASELSTEQQRYIATYVRDLGGGLIMVGGEDGFGAGGWNNTPLEEVLPLELDPPKELRLPTAALVLVLDKSGSMQRPVAGARASQQEIANEAAALAIESLRADSLVAVIAFDQNPHDIVTLQRNDNTRDITRQVRGIIPEGGTDLAPALLRAQEILRRAEVARKRIVCMSDGQSLEGDFDAIARSIAADNIKLTTIAVGDEVDEKTMSMLADVGGGDYYRVHNPRILPRVLVDSVQAINKPLIKEVPFQPQVLPTGSSITIGMDRAPILDGLVITAPRPDPRVIVEMASPDGEPLLARWQVGLGRSAAFTSDAQGQWSSRWLDWDGAAQFWTILARSIGRPAVSQDAELITEIADDRLRVALEVAGENGGFFDYLQVSGTVYRPDGQSVPIRLRQTAPGRYEGDVEALDAGNYIVALNPRQGAKQLSPVIGGINRSTSPEFRAYQSNVRLLEQVAEMTGGRALDLNQPLAVDLFDRSGMPPSVAILPAWQPILLIALTLLLLDVAARRLAWNMDMVKAGLAAAVSKVRPGHVRAAKASATLATLRTVSRTFDERVDADSGGIEKLKGTGVIAPPPDRPVPAPEERPAPEPGRAAAALDVLLGRRRATEAKGKAEGEEKRKPAKRDAKKPARPEQVALGAASDKAHAAEPGPGAGAEAEGESTNETTSSLLAAKRRARERLGGGPTP
jgi:uncharacterized membrane protein